MFAHTCSCPCHCSRLSTWINWNYKDWFMLRLYPGLGPTDLNLVIMAITRRQQPGLIHIAICFLLISSCPLWNKHGPSVATNRRIDATFNDIKTFPEPPWSSNGLKGWHTYTHQRVCCVPFVFESHYFLKFQLERPLEVGFPTRKVARSSQPPSRDGCPDVNKEDEFCRNKSVVYTLLCNIYVSKSLPF